MEDTLPGRIETGVRNLDAILHGGIPRGGSTIVVGPPGSGKTILTQQICFHNASADSRVLSPCPSRRRRCCST
jgi:circadian clock protein KaiC